MRNIIILKFSLLLLLLGTLGCAHMNFDSGNSESSILMGRGGESVEYTRMGEFSVVKVGGWLFWGITKTSHPNIGALIDKEVSTLSGNGVINLEIKSTRTFLDGFLGVITLGIYTRRTVLISGTVVKFTSSVGSVLGD